MLFQSIDRKHGVYCEHNCTFIQGRIQSNVVGGVPELLGGGVRARRREAPSSKCDQGRPRQREALAEGAAAGVWGAKIGLLES